MATTSSHAVTVTFTGDTQAVEPVAIPTNTTSPGQPGVYTNLANGANTISVPTAGSAVPVGVWIIPPSANTTSITLKGVSGDTGIALHLTSATFVSLASGVSSFVLTAGGSITGVRLIWV